jgi:KUP system potassium uptake protein
LGHFGRKPIQVAWLAVVLPALAMNYLGQGALLIHTPAAIENPFFRLYPDWALIPMVGLATLASVIASQAVITGAFSLTRQAVQLGLLPRLSVRHTSETVSGQIYMPRVNLALAAGVLLVVGGFRSSSALAAAYGVSVTATMVLTTMLAIVIVWRVWGWPLWRAVVMLLPLLVLEQIFFVANAAKIADGGWFPLLAAAAVFTAMVCWYKGSAVLERITVKDQADLEWLARKLEAKCPHRVHGTAVFLSGDPARAPTALMHNLKHNRVLHERNIVLSIRPDSRPRVPSNERCEVRRISEQFILITAHYGFMETPDVPKLLLNCRRKNLNIDLAHTSFFLSRRKLKATTRSQLPRWMERLYIAMSSTAEDATAYFRIPPDRVVEVGTQVLI